MARSERSAGFVIFHTRGGDVPTREYLLLDYGRHWDLPKGHLDQGEDDLTAAHRELEEETGLVEPRVVPGFHEEITYFFRAGKKGLVRKTVVFFLGEVSHQQIVLSDEHVGYVFLPLKEALARITFPNTRAVVKSADEFLTTSLDQS